MDEEAFNIQLRKFLKKVGITSQREIEKAVREAVQSGRLTGNETLQAKMTLSIPKLAVTVNIDDEISLE